MPDCFLDKVYSIHEKYSGMTTCSNFVQPITTDSFQIKLDMDVAVNTSPYRFSTPERTVMQNLVTMLLTDHIIKMSNSPFASPAILVKRKKRWFTPFVCGFS